MKQAVSQRKTVIRTRLLVGILVLLGIIGLNINAEMEKRAFQEEATEKHKILAPFVPSDFLFVKSEKTSGFCPTCLGIAETYKTHRTKESAIAEIIPLIRKYGYRADRDMDTAVRGPENYVEIIDSLNNSIFITAVNIDNSTDTKVIFHLPYHDSWSSIPEPIQSGPYPTITSKIESYDNPITIPSHTLLQLTGTGDVTTQDFTVNGDWDTYWQYDCSNLSKKNGEFKITGYFASTKTDLGQYFSLEYNGTKDNGIWPADPLYLKGTYFLKIETPCAWEVEVKG